VAAATATVALVAGAAGGDTWLRGGIEELFDTLVAVAHLHDPALLSSQAEWLAQLIGRHHHLEVSARSMLEALAAALAEPAPDAAELVGAAIGQLDPLG
jgi:hypothetical protein